MTRPFFPLAAALSLGIILGSLAPARPACVLPAIAAALVIALLCSAAGLKSLAVYPLLATIFLLGMLSIGRVVFPETHPLDISRLAGKNVYMEGIVSTDPRLSGEKTEITLESTRVFAGSASIPTLGKTLITVLGNEDRGLPRYGDLVRLQANLKAPHSFGNPGGFDYERFLLLKGIRVRALVQDPAEIVVIRENQGNVLRHYLEKYRSHLRGIIKANAVAPESGIIQAMTLGEQSEIPRDVYDKFSQTGTSHIIAISGFNISIIALCVFFVLRSLMRTSEKLLLRFDVNKISAIFSAIPIAAFAFIAGLGISTVRATVMIAVFLAVLLLDRERDLPNTLAFAVFVILMFSPASLFDVSFQLSFASVASILYLVPRISSLLPEEGPGIGSRALRALALFSIVTLSATLGTLPLILYYFNLLSLMVLPANLVLLPLLGYLVLFLSMGVMVVAAVSPGLAAPLVKAAAFFAGISIEAANFFSSLPFSFLRVPTPTPAEIAAFFILLYSLAELLADWKSVKGGGSGMDSVKRARMALALGSVVLFFAVDGFYYLLQQRSPGRFKAVCLDVGQAASTYIEFPGGRKMLVDGGGSLSPDFDVGRFVVAPFLWHERVTGLDYVVLTHPHPDHLGGLIFILKNFKVGEVWTNGQEADSDEYREFDTLIREKKVPRRIISCNSPTLDIGGAKVTFLNPGKALSGDFNNDAIAMRLRFGETSLLMPSDIMHGTEERLCSGRSKAKLRSTAVIAAHHGAGSSNSPAFLKAVSPETAVFSCGTNPYVPSPQVLESYEKAKAKIYRTDRDGAVTIRSDGEKLEISAWRHR